MFPELKHIAGSKFISIGNCWQKISDQSDPINSLLVLSSLDQFLDQIEHQSDGFCSQNSGARVWIPHQEAVSTAFVGIPPQSDSFSRVFTWPRTCICTHSFYFCVSSILILACLTWWSSVLNGLFFNGFSSFRLQFTDGSFLICLRIPRFISR